MKTIVTYITEDGKQFDNAYDAKKHECDMTEHTWEFYTEGMGIQKEQSDDTHMLFCKKCQRQQILK